MAGQNTPAQVAWNKLEDATGQRNWERLKEAWRDFVPSIRPGQPPTVSLSSYLEASEVIIPAEIPKGYLQFTGPREAVPEIVLSEAFYWLHKAIHVLGAAESDIDRGRPTWSLSSAYQSGFFAGRAVLGMLGMTTGERRKISFAADICLNTQGMSARKVADLGGAILQNINYRTIGGLMDHYQVWRLVQKALSMTTFPSLPGELTTFIRQLDPADITRQRHKLHYVVDYWVEADMHEFTFPEAFKTLPTTGRDRNMFSVDVPYFSLAVATVLMQIALRLFQDLSLASNAFKPHYEALVACINQTRHPVYTTLLMGCMV